MQEYYTQKIEGREKIMKGAKGKKHCTYRDKDYHLAFPQKPGQQEGSEMKYFKGLKEKKNTTKQIILYPVKLSFKGEGAIKNFSEK